MRSNGLTARAYRPVADLSPQVGDALLDELKAQGVAAYTTPVESSTTAGFDRPEFRVSVLERLYVDSAASEVVREMISQQHLMIADDSEDLTWAQIVAGFDQPLTTPIAPWPAQEDLDDPSPANGDLGGPRLGSGGHRDGQHISSDPSAEESGPGGTGHGRADPSAHDDGELTGSAPGESGASGGLGGLAGLSGGFADAGDSTIRASGGSPGDGGGAEAAQLGRPRRWMRIGRGTRGFGEDRRHGLRGRHHRRGGDAIVWGRRTRRTRPADGGGRSGLAWSAYDGGIDDFEDEIAEVDRFVPPVPPPLPKLTGWQKLTWLGLGGGPLVFLVAALGQLTLPPWLSFLAVVGFVGGFVGLVVMLTSHSDDDWDPDHGAQV